ncbi:MAG: hypothetical protein AAF329_12430 [Cyanobacteria bacterium P01_A01_bin.17]
MDQLKFAICILNEGCDDLQIWKLYQLLPDVDAAKDSYIRVVDDSGEDYLYPASRFIVFEFPEKVTQQLIAATPSAA